MKNTAQSAWEPFVTFDGVVVPIDHANVDTDAIIPKQFLKSIERTGFGDNLFDENVKKAKDFDTAMFLLKSKKGVLIHINNSRRAVYGYDQRVEVFGSKGMIISNNQTPTSVESFTDSSTSSKEPIFERFTC